MKALKGKTYDLKDLIKSKGGTWNAQEKCWYVPDEVFAELDAKIPRKNLSGQLWEECPRCGNEPVYLSLNCLCEWCG